MMRALADAALAGAVLRAPLTLAAAGSSPDGWTSVRDFGAVGDGITDDSQAFQAALRKARKVYVPRGRYMVGNLLLESGNAMLGEGADSILHQKRDAMYAASVNPDSMGTRDMALNARGITLHKLHFAGNCAQDGFAEHRHLLNINACSGMLIEDCHFTGFRGDGILIGSGNTPGNICHNERITVRACKFNGVNGQNRNGVSVIDGVGIVVEDCFFENCSRPDMPGAIDLEPDPSPEHVLRDITVRRNRITRCTGGVGAISLILPIQDFHVPPAGFLIEDNEIDGNGSQPGITLKRFAHADASTVPMQIRVRGNRVLRTTQPLLVSGLKDVQFVDNRYEDSLLEVMMSHSNHGNAHDVSFERNTFVGIGRESGLAMRLNRTQEITLNGNRFRDFGRSDGGAAIDASLVNPTQVRWAVNEFIAQRDRDFYSVILADDVFARAFAAKLDRDTRVNTQPVRWTAPEIRPPQRRRL